MIAGERLAARLARGADRGPALVSYVVAGYPEPARFGRDLLEVAAASDVVEIGLPFSDPVADGPVIAAAARSALAKGVCLEWLIEALRGLEQRPAAPLVLMSYLNPLMAAGEGLEPNLAALAAAGIEGLIVPDLPLEECAEVRAVCDGLGIALVQLVAPTSGAERTRELARASRGFVYAVARTGITGAATDVAAARAHLARVRAASDLPVAAGFGIRSSAQVAALAGAVDAAVVGTALIEAQNRGEPQDASGARFLRALRSQPETRR